VLGSPFVLSTLVPDTHRHSFARTYRRLLIITVALPGEMEGEGGNTLIPGGIGDGCKENEADGAPLEIKRKGAFEELKWYS